MTAVFYHINRVFSGANQEIISRCSNALRQFADLFTGYIRFCSAVIPITKKKVSYPLGVQLIPIKFTIELEITNLDKQAIRYRIYDFKKIDTIIIALRLNQYLRDIYGTLN